MPKVVLAGLFILLVAGEGAKAAEFRHPCAPQVQAFSKEANYMSLKGKFRLEIFQRTGVWKDLSDCYILRPMVPVAGSNPEAVPAEIGNLAPFTKETRYMSIRGYLRWLVYCKTGEWLPRNFRIDQL